MTADKARMQDAAKRAAQTVLLRNRDKVKRVAERFQAEGKPITVTAVARRASMTHNAVSGHLKALGLFEGRKRREKSVWEQLTPEQRERFTSLLLDASAHAGKKLSLAVQVNGQWQLVGKPV